MLRVEYARWGQAPADLRQLATSAPHSRTRERFLALYEITQESCATRVAERTRRHPQTVMEWLHLYNTRGPEAISAPAPPLPGDRGQPRRNSPCRPTLRRGPACSRSRSGAALRRLVGWVGERFGQTCCRETIRAALHRLGLSWKKAKKLLGRADPARRRAFVERLRHVLADAQHDRRLLVYLDEAHVHRDADLGYGWAERGRRLWVASGSPGLSAKVSLYGLYPYNEGQVRLWPYPRADGEHTIEVLRRPRAEHPDRELVVLW